MIELYFTNKALKFFDKHKDIKDKFIINLKNYYHNNDANIDIKKLKTYENIFRMRIGKYRIIYSIQNQEIKIINVLYADARGDIYKHF